MSPIGHGRNLYFAVSTPSGGAMTAITAYTSEVNGLPGELDMGDVTVGGAVGHASYAGLQKADFSSVHTLDTISTGVTAWSYLKGFQSLQQTYPSTAWGIQFAPNGTTAGQPMITLNALIKSMPINIKVTDPMTFTVNWTMQAGTTGITIGTAT